MRLARLAPLAFVVVPVGVTACLDRPVGTIEPESTRVSVTRLFVQKVEKLDLLIVVDNSPSMKDKQSELGRRIPELIAGVTKPSVDPETGRVSQVFDVHVGVITSSLGSLGTGTCHTGWRGPHVDDRGHLLPRAVDPKPTSGFRVDASGNPVASACPDVMSEKPLSWVKDSKRDPKAQFVGDSGAVDLQAASSCVVQTVNDDGCGFEATWEAIYRFLADPAPYEQAKVTCNLPATEGTYACSGDIKTSGVDQAVLAQRKAFLREDSLLAVIVLSDENDFSARPAGKNWLPWSGHGMPRAWPGCADVPDDFEPDDGAGFALLKSKYNCTSCAIDDRNPVCKPGTWPAPDGDIDHGNLRGFHQPQRFGFNTLWSRSRYVNAFTQRSVLGSDGRMGSNGIFAEGKRTKDMIVVAGIVGVPQGLVMDGDKPRALTDSDWTKMISPDLTKRDPHMIESALPRTALRSFSGDRSIDPVHGGERDSLKKEWGDLQYACIAKRTTTTGADDCTGASAATNPLCTSSGVQPYFKAYPGLRHLRILHDLDESGFVASICSESYSPAIRGITDKIRAAVDQQCIRSDIKVDDAGNASCFILETFASDTFDGKGRCEDIGKGYCTPGAAPCREENSFYPPVSPEVAATQITLPITVASKDGPIGVSTGARAEGANLYITGTDGRKHLVCEMRQLAGSRAPANDAQSCASDPKFGTPSTGGGWCYTTDPKVVGERCLASGSKGKVRFLGDAEPKNGSEVFTVCVGR